MNLTPPPLPERRILPSLVPQILHETLLLAKHYKINLQQFTDIKMFSFQPPLFSCFTENLAHAHHYYSNYSAYLRPTSVF